MASTRTDPSDTDEVFDALVENVPEVAAGTISVMAISRLRDIRSKIAVDTDDPHLDCVEACLGEDGERITRVSDTIGGEPIDVVRWSQDPATFVTNALAPARVDRVTMSADGKTASVEANPVYEPLAHGPHDENRMLASDLVGCKIEFV